MNAATTTTAVSTRQPVTVLGKIICGTGIFLALGSLAGAVAIGLPAGLALGIMAAMNVLLVVLIIMGLRWAPILGAVLSGSGLLYMAFGTPYPAYHLTHLQDPLFAPILLVVTLSAISFVTMLGAVAQNYVGRDGKTPRWYGYVVTGLAGLALGGILIGVSAKPAEVTPTTASDGATVVHLGLSAFSTTAVTVPVGMKLDFVDDSNIPHQLTYGMWSNGQTQLATPPNAPALDNHTISSGSFEIGPFTTPGTYHILCVIHPGMDLTVTVR
jgi:plastocyanin